jgi:outer membrane protein TolC
VNRFVLAALSLAALSPRSAFALQPLAEFIASGKDASFDNRTARTEIARLSQETWVAWTRLLPTFDARLSYTRNQYEASANFPVFDEQSMMFQNQNIVISAQDQVDGVFQIDLPLIDLVNWANIGVAKDNERAALAKSTATGLDVQKAIAKAYYQVVGAYALIEAGERTVKSSDENLAYMRQRETAGVAAEVDVKRAIAERERNRQVVADSRFVLATSLRLLETLSTLTPSAGNAGVDVSLDPPAPLDDFLAKLGDLPSVRAAHLEADVADGRTLAATATLFPTIAASAQERYTNAAGFVGNNWNYTLSATAKWHLDVGAIPARAAVKQQAEAAHIVAERATQTASDTIHSDWHQVEAQRQKATASRSEVEATALAAKLVKQRYEAGTAAWLDVILADRDAFSAEITRVRSDADLAYARAALAISSGQAL